MAAAWIDEREPATLCLARGVARPLWLGRPLRALLRLDARARSRSSKPPLRVRSRADGGPRGTAPARRSRARSFASAGSLARPALPERRLPPAGSRAAGGCACLERLARRSPLPPSVSPAERPVGWHARLRLRAAARARGTGRPSRRRAGRRAADRPATRRAASGPRAALRPSRPSSGGARGVAPARALHDRALEPLLALRARRNPPRAARSRASRTCAQYSDTDGSDRRRSARSRAVGVRPSSSPSRRSCSSSSSRVRKRRGKRPAARFAAFHVPKCSITVCGCTRASAIAGELAHRRRPADAAPPPREAPRGSPRPCSAGADRRGTPRARPRRCAAARRLRERGRAIRKKLRAF